jgi:hypothetical protein
MYACRNHPQIPSQRFCTHCRNVYCDACLVDFMGHPHCGYCRDFRVQSMSAANPYAKPKNRLRENLLLAAAIETGIAYILLFHLGLLIPAAVVGAGLLLTLIAALVAHIRDSS